MSSPPTTAPPGQPGTTPPGAPPGSVPPTSTPTGPVEPCTYIPGTTWDGSVGTFGPPRAIVSGPVLFVPTGAIAELPPQRWEYERVEIQQGGILKITTGSLSPFDLVVHGSMILHGTIEARNFDTAEITHSGTGPDGNLIRMEFKNDNKGGAGAYGENNGAMSGGAGAVGTTDAGGGGGGGAVNWTGRSPPRFARNGNPAVDERGAEPLPVCGTRGGDGGTRASTGNGGVVLLRVDGDFDGAGGLIDLRGGPGIAGRNGDPGGAPGWDACQRGGGGGGGGGPGGQGGYMIAGIKGRVISYSQVRTEGGPGGAAGAPRGRPGYAGRTGAARWFYRRADGVWVEAGR